MRNVFTYKENSNEQRNATSCEMVGRYLINHFSRVNTKLFTKTWQYKIFGWNKFVHFSYWSLVSFKKEYTCISNILTIRQTQSSRYHLWLLLLLLLLLLRKYVCFPRERISWMKLLYVRRKIRPYVNAGIFTYLQDDIKWRSLLSVVLITLT